ncbi:MAG: UPF0262 family protein [Rhodospirillales bacterium]|nr:UPF0262 family protein [Alphaproteobacteria bacterium]MCB9987271.1 UPF0262 family protein [Rhodospirillales bacterium]USO07872.1 MAG: UPF0262 family protein [Rhodospirillales bacterium]
MAEPDTPAPHPGARIVKIELDEPRGLRRTPMAEAERATAIHDLLAGNAFTLPGHDNGPYYLRIATDGHRLILRLRNAERVELPEIALSLMPLRRLIHDYFLICSSYGMAHTGGDRNRLESIDMARRGLHDEGATILRRGLSAHAEIDHATARSLFTLACVLQIGRVQPW